MQTTADRSLWINNLYEDSSTLQIRTDSTTRNWNVEAQCNDLVPKEAQSVSKHPANLKHGSPLQLSKSFGTQPVSVDRGSHFRFSGPFIWKTVWGISYIKDEYRNIAERICNLAVSGLYDMAIAPGLYVTETTWRLKRSVRV